MTNRQRPRLLWLSHFVIYPPHGGARIRSFHLFRELSQEFDIDLFMLDPRPKDSDGLDLQRERDELLKFAKHLVRFPLPGRTSLIRKGLFFGLSFFSSLPVTTLMMHSRNCKSALTRVMHKHRYAAVHIDTIDLASYLPIFKNTPIVLNHHNVESRLIRRESEYMKNPILREYFKVQAKRLEAQEQQLCPLVDCNLTVSELDKTALAARCPDGQFKVVANGVDTDYYQVNLNRFKRPASTMVWAGGMGWFPNRDAIEYFLTTIWPRLVKEKRDLGLLLIGAQPPDVLEKSMAPERIEATGYIPDVRPYFERSDVYIVPIRVGGGTRIKILDAFAAGIPVVSTSIGCEGLRVQDGRHLMIRDDPEDFAEAVIHLAENVELRQALASTARKLVEEQYSWRKVGREFREIYHAVISSESNQTKKRGDLRNTRI